MSKEIQVIIEKPYLISPPEYLSEDLTQVFSLGSPLPTQLRVGDVHRRVLTCGCFDLPHFGHLNFFSSILHSRELNLDGSAWNNPTEIYIAINSDESYRKLRGHDPVFPFEERAKIVSMWLIGMSYIQKFCHINIIKMNSLEPSGLIRALRPTHYVKGSEYTDIEKFTEADALREVGSKVLIIPSTHHHSSYYKDRLRKEKETHER